MLSRITIDSIYLLCLFFCFGWIFSISVPKKQNVGLFLESFFEHPKQCEFCKFHVRNQDADSTNKDWVITSGIKRTNNMIPFIRSLRTTGCQAQCHFLFDTSAYVKITRYTSKLITSCGGHIFETRNSFNMPPKYLRFLFCYKHIKKHSELMDRVIICDLYDTIFQGDPFVQQFGRKKLYIFDEGDNFYTKEGRENLIWMSYFKFSMKNPPKTRFYLCSGFIAGYKTILMKALFLFLNYSKSHMMSDFDLFHDQAVFNILYFSNVFLNNEIEVVWQPNILKVRHRIGKYKHENQTLGLVPLIKTNNVYAHVVHHYYSSPPFRDSLQDACPNTHYLPNYYHSSVKPKIEPGPFSFLRRLFPQPT